MPVVPFPTPNASASDLRRAAAYARSIALGTTFRGRPADAARHLLNLTPAQRDAVLAADDTLALVKVQRDLRRAHRTGDLDTVQRLRPQLARLCARLTDVTQRHRIKGWHVAAVLAVLLFAHGPVPAFASPSDCETIRDRDHREACRAYTSGRSSECEAIRNADERAECRARSE